MDNLLRGADILPHYADTTNYTEEEIILWQKIISSQATVFYTAKGLPFTYTIKGNEIFLRSSPPVRKERGIIFYTVE